jgi:hypothetical protein
MTCGAYRSRTGQGLCPFVAGRTSVILCPSLGEVDRKGGAMTRASTSGPAGEPPEIDPKVATEARVYDYLLGGETNFAIDRETAERQGEAVGGIERSQAAVRANRVFLREIVSHLAGDLGIRQFLDIGSGLPTEDNVHQVAQRVAPESRIVYVDNDPVVLAHAHELLESTSEGAASYVRGDMHDPEDIVTQAAETLDFSEPIAVMVISMLHFFPEDEDPYGIVARLVDLLPPGSHLVVSHITGDMLPEQMAALAQAPGEQARYIFVLRRRDEVAQFFDGLELVEPGVAPMAEWLPPDTAPDLREWSAMYYCGVGRKP